MKKLWKRLGALMMTLAMVLSLGAGITAFADGITNPEITFTGVANGDIVTAYRLVKYTNASYNSYTFDPHFGSFVDTKKGASDRETYLSSLNNNNKAIGALLDEYAKEVLKTSATYQLPTADTEKVSATASSTSVALTLEPGYYIVLTKTTESNSLIYTPVAVFVQVKNDAVKVYGGPAGTEITSDPQVAMKSETAPSIVKNVKDNTDWKTTNTAAFGDTVAFRVRVNIPAYTNPVTNMTLVLTDTLKNLAYKEGSVKVCSDEACSIEISNGVTKDATTTPYTAGTQKLVLNLDYTKIKSTSGATTVYVYYEATVQKEALGSDTGKATVDAANSVTLTYKNAADPSDAKTTGVSKTDTYTFALKVQKTQMKDGSALAGASFTVYKGAEGKDKVKFTQHTDGYYYPNADGSIEKIPVASDGTFLIKGLDAGNYWLEETTVPTGYYAPAGKFQVVLKSAVAADGTLGSGSAADALTAVNSADESLVGGAAIDTTYADQLNVTIKNSDIPTLPSTGGMGTMLFTVLGVILMALAAGLFFFRRRKNA